MSTELAKTEIFGSVIIRVFYKHFDNAYRYFIDVDSTNQHQNSWSRQIIMSNDPPDSELLDYCFFIHLKVIKHIQKTLKRKTSNLLQKTQYRKLYDAQEQTCYLCNEKMSMFDVSIDHVTPLSKGGKDKYYNKLLTHGRCNAEKSNRLPTKNELELLQDVHDKVKKISYYNILK